MIQKTTVCLNEDRQDAVIFTTDEQMKQRLARFSVSHPKLCRRQSSCTKSEAVYRLRRDSLFLWFLPPGREVSQTNVHCHRIPAVGKDIA